MTQTHDPKTDDITRRELAERVRKALGERETLTPEEIAAVREALAGYSSTAEPYGLMRLPKIIALFVSVLTEAKEDLRCARLRIQQTDRQLDDMAKSNGEHASIARARGAQLEGARADIAMLKRRLAGEPPTIGDGMRREPS